MYFPLYFCCSLLVAKWSSFLYLHCLRKFPFNVTDTSNLNYSLQLQLRPKRKEQHAGKAARGAMGGYANIWFQTNLGPRSSSNQLPNAYKPYYYFLSIKCSNTSQGCFEDSRKQIMQAFSKCKILLLDQEKRAGAEPGPGPPRGPQATVPRGRHTEVLCVSTINHMQPCLNSSRGLLGHMSLTAVMLQAR